jgi:hypothetical protein
MKSSSEMKKCCKCNTNKYKNEYYTNSARKDNCSVYCIECIKLLEIEKRNKQIKNNLIKYFISDDEKWKIIPINTNYEASTFGRIRNIKMKNVLTPFKYKSGYLGVGLRGMYENPLQRKTFKLHYLIAITYLSNPENKQTINHIDKNRENNKLSNLEWSTHREQIEHQQQINPPKYNDKSKKGISDLFNIDENEKWKLISENESFKDYKYYEISNYGRLKYKIQSKYKITLGATSADGYKIIRLNTDGNIFLTTIHRLVAILFIPNPENKSYVNHIDGNRENNNISNLEWTTPSENSQHAHDTGLNSSKKSIYQLDENNKIINEFESLVKAYEYLNKTILNGNNEGKLGSLSKALNLYNKQDVSRKYKGYYWCFKEDYKEENNNHTQYVNNKTKVIQYNLDTKENIKIWDSIMEASEFYSIQNNCSKKAVNANISSCCRLKRNKCQGFGWKYLTIT